MNHPSPDTHSTQTAPFFRLPRALFEDPRYHTLPAEAKLLYALLLDRCDLSRQHGWEDAHGVFCYFKLENVCALLCCGHDKATKLLRALEQAGLLTRCRQGKNLPAKLYLTPPPEPPAPDAPTPMETREDATPKAPSDAAVLRDSRTPAAPFFTPRTADFAPQGPRNSRAADRAFSAGNKNKKNKNKESQNHPSFPVGRMEELQERFKQQLDFQVLESEGLGERAYELILLMADALAPEGGTVRLGGCDMPREVVRARFARLDIDHIRYVLAQMQQNTTAIRNIRAYLLTALYDAPVTFAQHLQMQVNHDLYSTAF